MKKAPYRILGGHTRSTRRMVNVIWWNSAGDEPCGWTRPVFTVPFFHSDGGRKRFQLRAVVGRAPSAGKPACRPFNTVCARDGRTRAFRAV